MSAPNDGGPAFPQNPGNMLLQYHGMTLRDYFAAQAMAALVSRGPEDGIAVPPSQTAADMIASNAYFMADAMLAARTQEPGA